MIDVYFEKTVNRPEFIKKYFKTVNLVEKVENKSVLIKPNMVSYKPYPTTTHIETLQAVIRNLKEHAKKLVVGDGKAFDCDTDILQHPLAKASGS